MDGLHWSTRAGLAVLRRFGAEQITGGHRSTGFRKTELFRSYSQSVPRGGPGSKKRPRTELSLGLGFLAERGFGLLLLGLLGLGERADL